MTEQMEVEQLVDECQGIYLRHDGDSHASWRAAIRHALAQRTARPEDVKRIAELERSENALVGQRDDAEEAMSQAYFLVTGRSPEWSNHFVFSDALEEIEDACTLLRKSVGSSATLTPEQEAVGWQPIETSPKTSKARLVWCPDRENIYVVSWRPGHNLPYHWIHFGGIGGDLCEEPSHWMPMPERPAATPKPDPIDWVKIAKEHRKKGDSPYGSNMIIDELISALDATGRDAT